MEPTIKPFHLFCHQGRKYIINIEKMSASAVDKNTAAALGKIAVKTALPLDSNTIEKLEELGLLADGRNKTTVKGAVTKEYVPVVNLSLFLTQSCNLRCVYCYGDGGGYGRKDGFSGRRLAYRASGKKQKAAYWFFWRRTLSQISAGVRDCGICTAKMPGT